jgi:hypothetical protein
MAEIHPILDGADFDFNTDGLADLIVVENLNHTEVATPFS